MSFFDIGLIKNSNIKKCHTNASSVPELYLPEAESC